MLHSLTANIDDDLGWVPEKQILRLRFKGMSFIEGLLFRRNLEGESEAGEEGKN